MYADDNNGLATYSAKDTGTWHTDFWMLNLSPYFGPKKTNFYYSNNFKGTILYCPTGTSTFSYGHNWSASCVYPETVNWSVHPARSARIARMKNATTLIMFGDGYNWTLGKNDNNAKPKTIHNNRGNYVTYGGNVDTLHLDQFNAREFRSK